MLQFIKVIQVNLNRLINKIYGASLPIMGGCGESINDAIILYYVSIIDSYKIEQHVLDLMMTLQDYSYELIQSEMLTIDKKQYDKIQLKIECKLTRKIFVKNYYFNITNCKIFDPDLEYYPPESLIKSFL
ncbi:hypothetical protein [Methylomonas sp. YC3]